MIPEFNLPVLEKNEEFVIYEMPSIDLGSGVISEAEFQIHIDSVDEPELILRQPDGSDVDMRDFITAETIERIFVAFSEQGLKVAEATPITEEDEFIIYMIKLHST